MIKPNELRIGNLVYNIHNKQIIRIRQLRIEIVEVFHTNKLTGFLPFEDIEPIPLTEEIILECGFERKIHGRHEKSLRSYKKNGNTFNVSHSGIMYYGLKQKPVLYLHELQNLYFALTNQELKIEL